MKILVLIKQTPDTETKVVLSADKTRLDESGFKYIINPYDESAIEEALKIKGTSDAIEVVVCSVGNEGTKERLLKGLAMGADRGLLVTTSGGADTPIDSATIAALLAAVITSEKADLVLCGKQAIDDDNMHVGAMVAGLLDWPYLNVVTHIEWPKPEVAKVWREIEGGQQEVYTVTLPAVLGAHKSLNTPRYVSLPGIMKAKKKPLQVIDSTSLGFASLPEPKTIIAQYSYPPEKPKGKLFQGESVEVMVDKVVKLLREEAKIL